jgi:hypothetical protein
VQQKTLVLAVAVRAITEVLQLLAVAVQVSSFFATQAQKQLLSAQD